MARSRLLWPAVVVVSIWTAVALVSTLAPDFISGSQQEHLPFAAFFTWISGAIATGIALDPFVRRPDGGLPLAPEAAAGIGISIVVIWGAVAVFGIVGPEMVTGSDPTRLPIAALVAPIAGAFATRMVTRYVPLLAMRPST